MVVPSVGRPDRQEFRQSLHRRRRRHRRSSRWRLLGLHRQCFGESDASDAKASLHKARRQLRSPAEGLLLQLQLPLQPLGLQLPVSTDGSLPKVGLDDLRPFPFTPHPPSIP